MVTELDRDAPAGLARSTTLCVGHTLLPLIMATWVAGCGGEPALRNPAVTGPHGVPAIPIPGGLGFVESRLEPGSDAAPARQGGVRPTNRVAAGSRKGTSARIAIYFLEPDGKSPLTPLPEKVKVLLGMPGTLANHYIQPYDLENEPRADDPSASARFASSPFPLPEQRISGRVKAVLGGQEVSIPLVLSSMP